VTDGPLSAATAVPEPDVFADDRSAVLAHLLLDMVLVRRSRNSEHPRCPRGPEHRLAYGLLLVGERLARAMLVIDTAEF
jgi:hypothetical protein